MPPALEQANVRVMPDDDIQIAMSTCLLRESHMPRVKPVVTPRGHHLAPSRRRGHGRWSRETNQFGVGKHAIGNAFFSRELLAGGIRQRRLIHPQVRADITRQCVRMHLRSLFDDATDVPHGIEKVEPLGHRKLRRLAGDLFQRGIRPEQHGQFAKFGRLF